MLKNKQKAIFIYNKNNIKDIVILQRDFEISNPLPPLEKQQEIVDEIEQYQKVIDGARQVVENYKPSYLEPEPNIELGKYDNSSNQKFNRTI